MKSMDDGGALPDTGASPDTGALRVTEKSGPRQESFEQGPGRFRALVGGREVAVLDFRVLGDRWDLFHTFAEPAARGTGIASRLVRFALDRARADGVRVIPSCPYLPGWLDRHPDYRDLVAS